MFENSTGILAILGTLIVAIAAFFGQRQSKKRANYHAARTKADVENAELAKDRANADADADAAAADAADAGKTVHDITARTPTAVPELEDRNADDVARDLSDVAL